jgi:hypothetical protein
VISQHDQFKQALTSDHIGPCLNCKCGNKQKDDAEGPVENEKRRVIVWFFIILENNVYIIELKYVVW